MKFIFDRPSVRKICPTSYDSFFSVVKSEDKMREAPHSRNETSIHCCVSLSKIASESFLTPSVTALIVAQPKFFCHIKIKGLAFPPSKVHSPPFPV